MQCACFSSRTTSSSAPAFATRSTRARYAVEWVPDGRAGARRAAGERVRRSSCSISACRASTAWRCCVGCAPAATRRPVLILSARDAAHRPRRSASTPARTTTSSSRSTWTSCSRGRARMQRRLRGAARQRARARRPAARPGGAGGDVRGPARRAQRREFMLLRSCSPSAGQVLSRAQLEESLYGWDGSVESNTVDVHIHKLRKKLYPEVIRTVRGVGYIADPAPPEPAAERGRSPHVRAPREARTAARSVPCCSPARSLHCSSCSAQPHGSASTRARTRPRSCSTPGSRPPRACSRRWWPAGRARRRSPADRDLPAPRRSRPRTTTRPNPLGPLLRDEDRLPGPGRRRQLLVRSASAPDAPLAPLVAGFSTQAFEQRQWRVFLLRSGHVWVQVAERDDARGELSEKLALRGGRRRSSWAFRCCCCSSAC